MRQNSGRIEWFTGLAAIIVATVIWGYSNVVIRQGEAAVSPSILLWTRFGLASVVLIPAIIKTRLIRRHWVLGLATGALLGLSVLAQAFAMKSVPVDEVAFVGSLYVVFTPIGIAILRKRFPSKAVFAAVFVSVAGVSLLTGRITLNLRVGLIFVFLAAIGLSAQIIGTTEIAKHATALQIAGLQSVGATIVLSVYVVAQGAVRPSIYDGMFGWSTTEWIWISYMAIPATVVACYLQAFGQTRIRATEAALAFNIEPIWTAVFAWGLLSQTMNIAQMVGAVLILASLFLVSKLGEDIPAPPERASSFGS